MTFLQKVCEFDEPIQLKTKIKLKKLEVWKSIRYEIKNIQDRGSRWKDAKLKGSF